jgi:deoxyribonuclease V
MVKCIWTEDIGEAVRIQNEIAERVRLTPLTSEPETVAGMDVAFTDREAVCVVVVMRYKDLQTVEERVLRDFITFPYIPGYLSFREGPLMKKALESLNIKPDILLIDGQGIAHPRGAGIATHIGVTTGIPAVGCAKSKLVGEYEEPCLEKGCWSRLIYEGKTVGAVLRTRTGVKPVFVSPGHLVTLDDAIRVVLHCSIRYRLPEPIRRADHLSRRFKNLL